MLKASKIDSLLENNFFEKVRFLPKLCPEMEFCDLSNGISYINSNFASDTFNIVSSKNVVAPILKDQALNIMQFFNAKGLPFAWWVGSNSSYHGTNEILLSVGLKHVETEVGMAAYSEDIDSNIVKSLDDFKIKEVESLRDFADYGHVMASVFYPFDEEAVAFYKLAGNYYKKNTIARMFIGYVKNSPAGICFSINAEGIGGIYDIVTHPNFQRQGIGTFMTKIAIKQLKSEKCRIIGMQASEEGKGIYQKLGFRSFGEFKVYSNKHMLI